MDFHFQNVTTEMRYFTFTISAGSTRTFPLTIIDDSVAEYQYEQFYYEIGIYDPRRQHCEFGNIRIHDNDGRLH